MIWKIFAIAILAISHGMWAWSHCHETLTCEDIDNDLIGDNSWAQYNVDFYVNSTVFQDKPKLGNDCRTAAYVWSNIRHEGEKIAFSLTRKGATEKVAKKNSDGQNVVSYGPLQYDDDHKIYAETFWFTEGENPNVFTEIDLRFNQSAPFEEHRYAGFGEVCNLHIATHEFGHWLGLLDLHEDTCEEYEHYTMLRGQPTGETNSHWRETLSCEDKFAAVLMYGTD